MHYFQFIILVCYLFINEVFGSPSSSGSRIVGGYEAPLDAKLFHASLQNENDVHVCGGAIVSKNHILTAAHCVQGTMPYYITVVVGTTNLDDGGSSYDVSEIRIIDSFDFSNRIDDIAILKINGTFNTQETQILNLHNEELNEGDSIILTGFGAQELNGATSRRMYALNLTVFDQETCKYAMRYVRDIQDEMFCTFSKLGQGTCHGDSGGPLVKGNHLVGIVSWGIPCAMGYPDVHTRITPYISWIQEQIAK